MIREEAVPVLCCPKLGIVKIKVPSSAWSTVQFSIFLVLILLGRHLLSRFPRLTQTMESSQKLPLRSPYRDFPAGPVVKNPPSNAGDVGSIPGRGPKIPHAVGQLNPCTTTREPVRRNERSCVLQLRPNAAK